MDLCLRFVYGRLFELYIQYSNQTTICEAGVKMDACKTVIEVKY